MTKRHVVFGTFAVLFLVGSGRSAAACCFGITNFLSAQSHFTAFWIPILTVPVYFGAAFLLGRCVQEHGWQVSDTRKLLALALYFAPLAMSGLWLTFNPSPSFKGNTWDRGGYMSMAHMALSVSMLVTLLCTLTFIAPLRRRSRVLSTAFASIDRPEDHPHTLWWLLTSMLATWAVIAMWLVLRLPPAHLMTALFIAGVGDALAEPIGVRFGARKYSVRALGTRRVYWRSLEGSACVFFSAVIGITIFVWGGGAYQSALHVALAMLIIPLAATLAEARSPHTWDQPIIVAACGAATFVVLSAAGP